MTIQYVIESLSELGVYALIGLLAILFVSARTRN